MVQDRNLQRILGMMDVMYSVDLINKWTSAIQCVLFAREEKDELLIISLVTSVIAANVGTVGGVFYSI